MAPSTRRLRRNRPEQALHLAVAQFLNVALPRNALWWHTPNGGARSPVEGGIFKAMGVLAGMPDILILSAGKLYAIELKAIGGRVSTVQTATDKRLLAAGCHVGICRSIGEVEFFLSCCGVPLRASSGRVGEKRAA